LSDNYSRSQISFSSLESYKGSSCSDCGDEECNDIGALLVSSKSLDDSSKSSLYKDESFAVYLLMYTCIFSLC